METKVNFASKGCHLEAMYNKVSGSKAAVVTHPHPLYGGDMSNPVVEAVVDCYNRKGYSTLRFNFRGVGGSEGEYGGGVDEQADVEAAVSFLTGQSFSVVHLVGYSFGAWVLAHMKKLPEEVTTQVFVAPPLAFMAFEKHLSLPLLRLALTGEEDEIAPPRLVAEAVTSWNPEGQVKIIDFADHFFYGCFPALEKELNDFLSTV